MTRDIYFNSNLNPLTKLISNRRSIEFKSNDHMDHPNQHKNSNMLCNEMGHPVKSLTETVNENLRQHDQNVPMDGKPL